jgi:maltose alpha-D-glucosyltransferase/alpha-amylase
VTFADMTAAEPPRQISDVMFGYLETAEKLGRRTAEVHLALASDSTNLAFAPEPFTPEDLKSVSMDATAEARKAFDVLEHACKPGTAHALALADDVAVQARELWNQRDHLLERLRAAPSLDFTATKIRVHGDYHLGQVLWAEGDFYILDFEGEPARPIEQRRQKQSPLKDVAGMLRSFGYAAYASLFAHTASRPAEFERLEGWARLWQTWSSAAFLRAYLQTAGAAQFVPTVPSQRDVLLQLFVIDKALYELNYELNNRPDWVRIPLSGILEILHADRETAVRRDS